MGGRELYTLLRDVRLEAGLAQREVVEILNRPQSYLSAVEIGGCGIDMIIVRELCKIYGLPFVQFVERFEGRIKTSESKRRPPRRPRQR